MGRLKPGVSIEQAQAELATLYFQTFDQTKLKTDYYLRNLKFELEPVRANSVLLRDQFAKPLLFVMAVVGLLLLIACTNVASMLLARGAAREREMALRRRARRRQAPPAAPVAHRVVAAVGCGRSDRRFLRLFRSRRVGADHRFRPADSGLAASRDSGRSGYARSAVHHRSRPAHRRFVRAGSGVAGDVGGAGLFAASGGERRRNALRAVFRKQPRGCAGRLVGVAVERRRPVSRITCPTSATVSAFSATTFC